MNRSQKLTVLLVLVGIVATAFVVMRIRDDSTGPASRPNILLVTFDTTRADRLGAYEWRPARTPAIDGLAREGVVFTRAYSPAPLTLPSHSSIMTGLYPFYHGVRENTGFQLDERARTLAELVGAHGYRTGAVVGAFVLDAQFGLDQGFEDYLDDMPRGSAFESFEFPERSAERIADDAIKWLDGLQPDRPFLLWCHFFDPHAPYEPPESFTEDAGDPYDREIAFADVHLKRLLDHLDKAPPNANPVMIVLVADHGESLGEHSEATHEYFVYDSTLHVPLVIRMPDRRGAGTTVDVPVTVADIMPTILDVAGLPVPDDDELHGRSLAGLVAGQPAVADAFRRRPIYFETYAPLYSYGWAPLEGVRVDMNKYISAPQPELYLLAEDSREGAEHNAYQQETELAAQLAGTLSELRERQLRFPPLSGQLEHMDAEAIAKLRSLGYVAGPAAVASDWTADDDPKARLPLYLAIHHAMGQIRSGDLAAGCETLSDVLGEDPRNPRSLVMMGDAVARDPRGCAVGLEFIEAAAADSALDVATRATLMVNCGQAYLSMNEPQRALSFFEQAGELRPDDHKAHWRKVIVQLHLKRPDLALEPARRALALVPDEDALKVLLGLIYFCTDQLPDGAREWGALMTRESEPRTPWDIADTCAADPSIASWVPGPLVRAGADASLAASVRAALHAAVGRIALDGGNAEEALASFRAAATLLNADDPVGLRLEATALTNLDRPQEARDVLQRAYELDGHQLVTVVDLAMMLHRTGDQSAAIDIVSEYYAAHPEEPTAANNLAWMLAERARDQSDLERALTLADFAVRRRPSSAGFIDTLGWVFLKRKEPREAIAAFARAVQLAPGVGEHHYHLGLAFRLAGQQPLARESFAKAVECAPTPHPAWYADAVAGAAEGARNSL